MKNRYPRVPIKDEIVNHTQTACRPTRRLRGRGRRHPLGHRPCAAVLAAVLALAWALRAPANTYTVSTAAPLGPGSLADAILQANANPGPDVIVFAAAILPAKIVPVGPLPDILDSVVIDATSPPNCPVSFKPVVELDGSAAGLNANGLTALGTAVQPIAVTIKGLAIHSFSGAGIMLQRNTNSVIQGNYLGTDPGGVLAFPNARGLVLDSCTNVLVGGVQPCERNVVSGNQGDGIGVANGDENRVVGNWVGLTANGSWPMPNGVGVSLFGCTRCQLGTLTPGEGNVISRNSQAGVQVNGGLFVPMDTRIEGNFIGTLPDGASPAGNGGEGIFFFGGPTKNTVRGNLVAWNGAQGVSVLEGIDNTIVENSIYKNGGLGIDITPVGAPNPNDPCDPDAGPNRQQNYPILTAADNLGGTLQLAGVLDSEPGLPFRLDFYWQAACDVSGFGEGKHYIGQGTVGPGGAGSCVNSFSFSFPVDVPAGNVVTATATHPQGSTSEFSPCVPVVGVGTNVIHHAGLPHTPLGNATLVDNNGWLDVSLFNGGGSNGVRLALGRAEGWQAALDSFELLPGDSYQLSVSQDSADLNPQPLPPHQIPLATASLSLGASGLTFGGNFTPGGSSQPMDLRLEFRDDQDQLVSVVRFPNGGEYNLPPCTNIYQQYIVCSNAYVSLHSGEPAFCWRFCHVTCIPPGPYPGVPYFPPERVARTACLIAEVPWRLTNACILCPKVDVGTNQFAGTIDITANLGLSHADGGHLRLGQEWLQQFDRFHQASGAANLTGWVGGGNTPESLNIGLPGSPAGGFGSGGAVLSLDRARYVSAGVDWGSPVAPGSYGGLIVGTNHVSDNTIVTFAEAGVAISFGFELSGAGMGRLDFFNRGQPVTSVTVATGSVLQASSPPFRLAAATSPNTPLGGPGFGINWGDAVSIIIVAMPGAGGQILADEVHISPVAPAKPLPWFTHFDLVGGGINGFEIMDEDVRPAMAPPLTIQAMGRQVELSCPTEPNRPYQLEWTSALDGSSWQVLNSFFGDGSTRTFLADIVVGQNRFYRLNSEPTGEAPMRVTCPGDMTLFTLDAAGAVGNFVTLVGIGDCPLSPSPSVTCNPPSGSTFPVGSTTVLCVGNDGCGERPSCTFQVNVVLLPPVNAPQYPFAQPLLPPPNGEFAPDPSWSGSYGNGVVLSNVVLRRFTQSFPPPPAGAVQTDNFSAVAEMDVSTDGGVSFNHIAAPANLSVQISSMGGSGGTQTYDTEMLALDITGGTLPGGVMVRESPSKASLGRTSVNQAPASGQFLISSFFDIFTELSLDGGQTWNPMATAPAPVVLRPGPNFVPYLLNCPADMTVYTFSSSGAAVSYTVPTAGPPFPDCPFCCYAAVCNPPSGSTFPVGTTVVNCSGSDGCGERPTCSFNVTVDSLPYILAPEYSFAQNLLPPPSGAFASDATGSGAYANGVVLSNAVVRRFLQSFPPPVTGGTQTDNFGAVAEMDVSTDGGRAFAHFAAPANLSVRISPAGGSGGTQSYDTEMLVLDITGGTLPAGVMIRESPSKMSLGRTTVRQDPASGQFMISSFFDIFTELSTDGGQTWSPLVSGPTTVVLKPWPNFAPFGLHCPPDMTVNTFASSGSVVNFPLPTDGPPFPDCPLCCNSISCNPPSGSVFPVGTNSVTCSGVNGCREQASCSFQVTVNLLPFVLAPEYAYAQNLLPPPNGQFATDPAWAGAYGNGVVLSNVVVRLFTESFPPPPAGVTQTDNFSAVVEMDVSMGAGAGFAHYAAPASVSVQIASSVNPGGTQSYDTEMLVLDITGGTLPAGVMIRESPSKMSLGRTSVRQSPASGQFLISSFFDIFTELSLDGGQTWSPLVSGFATVVLTPRVPFAPFRLLCPGDMSVFTVSSSGTVVNYPLPTDGPPFGDCPLCCNSITCNPPSGSLFPLGTTTVACNGVNGCHEQASCSFNVAVIQVGGIAPR